MKAVGRALPGTTMTACEERPKRQHERTLWDQLPLNEQIPEQQPTHQTGLD
jgi:hypothetical protein